MIRFCWHVWNKPSSLAKGYDPLPSSPPLTDRNKISETQGNDFHWLQSKLAASNQKAPITWSRVFVESVCRQLPRAYCATSLYIPKHTTILSDNVNVFNQLIEVPVYVSCTNACMSTYIFVSCFTKCINWTPVVFSYRYTDNRYGLNPVVRILTTGFNNLTKLAHHGLC